MSLASEHNLFRSCDQIVQRACCYSETKETPDDTLYHVLELSRLKRKGRGFGERDFKKLKF